ncbi:4'-phosphopantetheinyl transferase [Acinetobacter sichuanensis]|uniref:Enterobactin synthase component D n=1 Tax=Acinetobacter sichuanensis TaxID=2136183 RepID=A0A371YM06_9GAMM|nr:4'-phosphopantetheinyl transferase superfamily protein [Acinetobacter sichuanensis]RFC82517.1 NrgA [Acinetobacter sichuanensis]
MNEPLYFQKYFTDYVFEHAQKLELMQDCVCYQLDLEHIDVHLFKNLTPPKYLEQAVSTRLSEFYSGRILIQAILMQYYEVYEGVTSLSQRLPQWTPPFRGSISHSKNQIVVAVSASTAYLGIDIEHWVSEALIAEGQHLILNHQDYKIWDEIKSELSFQQFLTLVFSIKESLYKAVYPEVKHYIDFLDAAITEISLPNRCVKLKFSNEIQNKFQLVQEYEGYWEIQEDYVLTWVYKTNQK